MKIIDDLSGYTESGINTPPPLDKILHMNRSVTNTLTGIISQTECKESKACPLLVAVALEQLAALFESTLRATCQAGKSAIPPLQLGSFLVEGGDAMTIRSTITTRELQRVIRALEALTNVLSRPSLQHVHGALVHKGWTEEMAMRLRNLVGSIEQSWS